MQGAHPQMPIQPGFQNPVMAPGPNGVMGPNHMPHHFPPGVIPPPSFQGRIIRPSPHVLPPRSRMPMAGPPRGPMPPGPPIRPVGPVGFPPRSQPFVPGMPPRTLVPHMACPPGPPLRMVSRPPILTGPASGMQARFPGQGSPQHRPPAFRHPSASNSPSPPISRPDVSPLTSQSAGHKPGFVGAPRWPVVRSNVVKRGNDTTTAGVDVKLLPTDKKVMCLMRGAPGSGKSTLAR